jgi:RHS repeat-associated protein
MRSRATRAFVVGTVVVVAALFRARFRVALAGIVLAGLVLGVVSAIASPAEPAVAAAPTAPASHATPLTQPKVSEPSGDFSDLDPQLPVPKVKKADKPRGFDAGSAQVTSRNEFSDTSTDAHGVKQVTLSNLPVNVKVGKSWVPSETSLSSAANGQYQDDTHPLRPRFGAKADAGSLLHVERDGATLDFRLKGAGSVAVQHPVVPFLNTYADRVAYPKALPGVDLTYQVQTSGVKESLVLKSAPTKAPTYTWIVSQTGDLTASTDKLGNLEFAKKDGDVVFTMPAPEMWDSSDKGGEKGGEIKAVAWTTHQTAAGWEITVTPSFSWLTDSSRVYPVTIDPTINPSGDGPIHSYKSDGNYNNGHALLGYNAQGGGCCNWRAIVHYNYEQLYGQQLTGAFLRMAYYSGQVAGEGDCFNMNIYWATAMSYNGAGPLMGSMPYCYSNPTTQSGDIGNYFNQWIDNGQSGGYLLLVGDESQFSYRAMNTSIVFNYVGQPVLSSISGPVNGARSAVQPILSATASDPTGGGLSYDYQFSTTSNFAAVAYDSGRVGPGPYQAPVGALAANTTYYYRVLVSDWDPSYSTWSNWQGPTTDASRYFSTNTPAPAVAQSGVYPTDKSVVSTASPLFTTPTVTDVNGDPVQYQFRIATGANGNSGAVTTSGWLPLGTTSWTPPAGTLQDGVAYTLQVLTYDGWDTTTPPWVTHFTENLRIGDNGPSPTDSEGPVTVNLANGNASLSFTTPTVSTVGGPIGLSFQYNSLASQTKYQGLMGSYYNALIPGQNSTTTFAYTNPPVLTRVDPTINFLSSTAQPAPSVPATYFLAKWTGFVRVPTTGGPYTFGTNTDDGSKLTVGGTQLINQWVNNAGQVFATSTTPGGGPVPIEFDMYQATTSWAAQLLVKDGSGNIFPVPSAWLTTSYQSLPAAWSSSAPLTGDASDYVSATVTTSSITLTDSSGTAHVYTPPAGETGVVALDGSGNVTFTDDGGTVYSFNQAGKIANVTVPADLLKRATPQPSYDTTTGRTISMVDPLSSTGGNQYSRQVSYIYQGDTVSAANGLTSADSDGSGTNACPIPSDPAYANYVAPPVGTLCRIVYPGHVPGTADTTQLFYYAQSAVCPTLPANMYDTTCLQLAAIQDPGASLSSFSYDSNGRLSGARNPVETDWVNVAGSGRSFTTANETTIGYDAAGRATSVTLPAPDGVTASTSPKKTYTYNMYADASGGTTSPVPIGAATGTTDVDVTGAYAAPAGHSEVVTFNSSLQQLTSTAPSGLTTQNLWNNHDDLLATLTPQGQESTSIYDSQDRETAGFGPAPANCYAANSLTTAGAQNPGTGSCAALSTPVEQSTTSYDSGLQGLDAQWFPNATLTGPPTAETVGVGTGDGSVNATWTQSAVPATGINSAGTGVYSARLTGTITFPTAGNYTLSATVDDTAQVYLNDQQIINASTGTTAASAPFTATAGQVARIRIDYQNAAGAGGVQLLWVGPAGGAAVTVPGADLSPNYSLVTGTTDSDAAPSNVAGVSSSQVPSTATSTGYGSSPWLGQATSSSVDPSGLNLTSTSTYEGVGSGLYGRQLTSTKPAGSATTSTNSYYGAAQSYGAYWSVSSAICGLATSTPQSGMLAKTIAPTNSSGTAIETDYIYDLLGRTVATKSTGDADWSCTSYDARGRVTTVKHAATSTGVGGPSGEPARTVSYNYAVGGDPLTTSVGDDTPISGSPNGDTVTTVSDLDGNTVKYTDVWGTVTTSSYNQADQLLTTKSTPPGGAASTLGYAYDVDGNLTKETLNGSTIAVVSYGSTDLVTSVSYPNSGGGVGNGTSLSSITRDAANRQTGLTWSFAGSSTVSDQNVLSQSGRVLQDSVVDNGGTPQTSTYSYDTAGRLTSAAIPGHVLSYGFGPASCGADASAGKDGNRTSYIDAHTVAGVTNTTSVAYCYDNADRLTGTTVAGAPFGAAPVLAGNLTATGPGASLVYDVAGETTTLANESLIYDSTGRHIGTTTTGASPVTVTYVRDVTDRIVAQTTNTTTVRYSYTGDGDSADYTLTTSNVVSEHTLGLPGGVTVSIRGADVGSAEAWSYSNLHGDDIVTADATGARTGAVSSYDPFGDPIDPVTGNIGTVPADTATPSNTAVSGTSYGWEGSHQKLDENAGDISTIEMGDRQYVPLVGRFLTVDPIEGGNPNDYIYPNDPNNTDDLTGDKGSPGCHNPRFCVKYRKHKAAVQRASQRLLYSKKNKSAWEAAAFIVSVVGLVGSGIPGVDLVVGYVTGGVAAAYDCNYGHRVMCGVDVI